MQDGVIWRQIHETLTQEIGSGHYPKGEKLPSEAALAKRFSVNRHTVRRALGALQTDGLILVRRGAGAFVQHTSLDYRLGSKTRFSQNLSGTGLESRREILRLETIPASRKEAELLGLTAKTPVHVAEMLSLVDDAPFSYSRSVLPATTLPNFPIALRNTQSITKALAQDGVRDYSRAWTKLTAKRAVGVVARVLHVANDAPVLRSISLNLDANGGPIEYGRTWFHGDRAQLVVEGRDF